MELDNSQKEAIRAWVNEGLNLSDVQKKIESDFDLNMTYMDVRFLVDDLEIDLSVQDPEEVDEPEFEEAVIEGVSVDVDVVTRPGTMVSGSVHFSDGVRCDWQMDSTGRLGIVPGQEGYQPSEEDLKDFQAKLQQELQKKGF